MQGIRARRRVPRPGGLESSSVPLSAATRSDKPAQPGAVADARAAHAVVCDLDQQSSVDAFDADGRVRRVRVLRHVGEGLRDHEVGGGLDGGGEATIGVPDDLDRDRSAGRQRADRRFEAVLGEHRGVDPAREIAKLLQASASSSIDASRSDCGLGAVGHAHACEAEVQRQGHEPCLRAVVEVALESPALGVGGLDQSRA